MRFLLFHARKLQIALLLIHEILLSALNFLFKFLIPDLLDNLRISALVNHKHFSAVGTLNLPHTIYPLLLSHESKTDRTAFKSVLSVILKQRRILLVHKLYHFICPASRRISKSQITAVPSRRIYAQFIRYPRLF